MELPDPALVRSYLQSGVGTGNVSHRSNRGAVRTSLPLGSSRLQPKSLTHWPSKAGFCSPWEL